MRTFAILTILFAVFIGFTAGGKRGPDAGSPAAKAPPSTPAYPPPQPPPSSPGTVQIERGWNGRFMVEGYANGTTLDFIVDTGASHVALSRGDAARLGITVSDADFAGQAQTASGTVAVAGRTLPQLRIGSIQLYDVPVLILDAPAPPLLGQSVLARMSRIAIEGDRMTLTKL